MKLAEDTGIDVKMFDLLFGVVNGVFRPSIKKAVDVVYIVMPLMFVVLSYYEVCGDPKQIDALRAEVKQMTPTIQSVTPVLPTAMIPVVRPQPTINPPMISAYQHTLNLRCHRSLRRTGAQVSPMLPQPYVSQVSPLPPQPYVSQVSPLPPQPYVSQVSPMPQPQVYVQPQPYPQPYPQPQMYLSPVQLCGGMKAGPVS